MGGCEGEPLCFVHIVRSVQHVACAVSSMNNCIWDEANELSRKSFNCTNREPRPAGERTSTLKPVYQSDSEIHIMSLSVSLFRTPSSSVFKFHKMVFTNKEVKKTAIKMRQTDTEETESGGKKPSMPSEQF